MSNLSLKERRKAKRLICQLKLNPDSVEALSEAVVLILESHVRKPNKSKTKKEPSDFSAQMMRD